jgi:hypothetical protein
MKFGSIDQNLKLRAEISAKAVAGVGLVSSLEEMTYLPAKFPRKRMV